MALSTIDIRALCVEQWVGTGLRIRIYLVQESSTIALFENTRKAPWLLLEGLNVLYLNNQDVPWLCRFNLKRASQVVNLSEVNIFHVISAVVILNLAARPVNAFNFDDFAVLDCPVKGN